MMTTLFFATVVALNAGAQLDQYANVTLSAALEAAVTNSPAVQQARAHVAETQALLQAARRSAGPEAVASHLDTPQTGPNGTVDQSLTTLGGSFSLTNAAQRTAAVEQARATIVVAQLDALDAEHRERAALIDHYYGALRAEAEVAVRRSLVSAAQRDLAAARIRYDAGDAPRLDIVRAQVDLTRANADLDSATVATDNAVDALCVQTGIDRARFSAVAGAPLPELPARDESILVERALARRADVASASGALEVERTGVRVAERSNFPDVTVTAGYTQGVDAGAFVRGPSATVSVGVPIGSSPVQARTQAARERVRAAEMRVAQIERDIRLEVAAAVRTTQAASRSLQAALSTLRAAEDEERAVTLGYKSGASTSLEVAEARRVAQEAAIHALDARYAEAQSRATLLEAIGS